MGTQPVVVTSATHSSLDRPVLDDGSPNIPSQAAEGDGSSASVLHAEPNQTARNSQRVIVALLSGADEWTASKAVQVIPPTAGSKLDAVLVASIVGLAGSPCQVVDG